MPPDTDNAKCPSCETKFGYVVKDGQVTCPMCKTAQELPVIMVEHGEYRCLNCNMDFSSADSDVRCPMCFAYFRLLSL